MSVPDLLDASARQTAPLSYEGLFRRHFGEMVRLAALLGADDPADVAQEAFVRLHRHRSRLRDESAALPYLRRTVANLARSRLRHLNVVRRHLRSQAEPVVPSAEELALRSDQTRRLHEALQSLAPQQRELLVLRYWLDLTGPEIAQTLKQPLGTVKSQTSRALEALARRLEPR